MTKCWRVEAWFVASGKTVRLCFAESQEEAEQLVSAAVERGEFECSWLEAAVSDIRSRPSLVEGPPPEPPEPPPNIPSMSQGQGILWRIAYVVFVIAIFLLVIRLFMAGGGS